MSSWNDFDEFETGENYSEEIDDEVQLCVNRSHALDVAAAHTLAMLTSRTTAACIWSLVFWAVTTLCDWLLGGGKLWWGWHICHALVAFVLAALVHCMPALVRSWYAGPQETLAVRLMVLRSRKEALARRTPKRSRKSHSAFTTPTR